MTATAAKPNKLFRAVDVLLLVLAVLPLLAGIVIRILFYPATEGIDISGALIYFTLDTPIGPFPISESQVNSWLVMLTLFWLCLYLTHGITPEGGSRRQHLVEWAVEQVDRLVCENMGEYFAGFAPFIIAMMALSAFSSLLSLLGLHAPTSDINVVGGWALLVFFLITYFKMKCGPLQYLRSFTEPVPLLLPLNLISEVATPVSMAFRHYGNILSGAVISALLGAALTGLSKAILGGLPGILGDIPLLRVGVPAVLSIYFDVFSGLLQAFIFATLTMLYVAGGFPAELYARKKAAKSKKRR
ncbi:MAG: F0F1 ATP synthase subunit A [Eubacteriales bacterium]|nr:F0F1 ATP synthase subunit A [Eubacteriales bacterium]